MKEKRQKQKTLSHARLQKDYEIFHYLDDEDFHISLHSHDFYEFYYLISGNLSYQIMDTYFTLQPGAVLLININQLHRSLTGNMSVPYDRIVIRISYDILKSLSSEQSNLAECFCREQYSVYYFPPDTQNNIRLLLSKLLSVQEQQGFGSELLYKAYLTELFVLVNRYCRDSQPVIFNDSAQKSQLIEMVNHYIRENLDKPITVDELAEYVYLSRYYFMHTFKTMTGISVYQYIIQKRLIEACDLILGGASITHAYQHCGFEDYSCFFRAFKKHFGYSPKKYIQMAADASERSANA